MPSELCSYFKTKKMKTKKNEMRTKGQNKQSTSNEAYHKPTIEIIEMEIESIVCTASLPITPMEPW